jgi:putative ABC transport system permease protein
VADVFLAFREMRRALVRFGLLVFAIGLLLFLILIQQALQDGLITAFVGGIRNQSAPVLVYSVDGQRTLQGSFIAPALEKAVRGTAGVGSAARLNQSTFTVRVGDARATDAAIVGSGAPDLGVPTTLSAGRRPAKEGEAVGSAQDFALGDKVTVLAAGRDAKPVVITVVGLAGDVQISVTRTLFTDLTTFAAAVRAANPDAAGVPPNAIAVRPAAGVTASELVARINQSSPEADALTRQQAADDAPGVSQVRRSFQVIFLLYALVIPLVTGLFFLIITLQKAGSLTLLRAMGAGAAVLTRSLLVQVAVVMALGIIVGTALYAPLSQAQIGSLTLHFDGVAVLVWSVLLLTLGLASALVSIRRVLRIDPIEATTGAGVR